MWTNTQKSILMVTIAACIMFALVAAWAVGSRSTTSSTGAIADLGSRFGNEGVRVSGTAVVRANPDLATVTLGYESRALTSRKAKADNDAVMKKIKTALRQHGVESADVQTCEYRLFPIWEDWKGYKEKARVWHVLHMVEVRVRRVDKVADVVDAASSAGADKITDIQFSVEDLHSLRAQARKMAAKVAREKAEQLAELMGARLGRVVAITDSNISNYYPWRYYGVNSYANVQMHAEQEPASGDAESVVSSGQVAIEAREEVVFALN